MVEGSLGALTRNGGVGNKKLLILLSFMLAERLINLFA